MFQGFELRDAYASVALRANTVRGSSKASFNDLFAQSILAVHAHSSKNSLLRCVDDLDRGLFHGLRLAHVADCVNNFVRLFSHVRNVNLIDILADNYVNKVSINRMDVSIHFGSVTLIPEPHHVANFDFHIYILSDYLKRVNCISQYVKPFGFFFFKGADLSASIRNQAHHALVNVLVVAHVGRQIGQNEESSVVEPFLSREVRGRIHIYFLSLS